MSSQNNKCEKCGEEYISVDDKWCKPCHINCLKNLVGWSNNKELDDLIQEMQLQINRCNDIVFEWIPHNQFKNIKEISKGDLATVHSAIWKDGPLYYNYYYKKYTRNSYKKVVLKRLYNSQN